MYSFGKPSTDSNAKPTTQTSYFPFTASTQQSQSTQPMSFFAQVQQTAQQSQSAQQQSVSTQQSEQQPQQATQQSQSSSFFSQPQLQPSTQQPSSQTQQPSQTSFFSQLQTQPSTQSFFSQSQPTTNQPSSQSQPMQQQSSFFPPQSQPAATQSFFSPQTSTTQVPISTTLASTLTPNTDVTQLLTKIVDLQSQTLKLQEQMQTSLSSLTNQSKVVFNRTCDGCNSVAIIGEIHTALNHCVYDLCSDCYKTKKPPGAIFVTVTSTEALEYLLTMQKFIPTK